MLEFLKDIHDRKRFDDWSEELVQTETTKFHATVATISSSLMAVLLSPTSTEADREWARKRMDKLLAAGDD